MVSPLSLCVCVCMYCMYVCAGCVLDLCTVCMYALDVRMYIRTVRVSCAVEPLL